MEKIRKGISKHSENKWAILAVLVIAQFMVVLDVSIVNVALPSIAKDLKFAPNNIQWVITAYTLTFTSGSFTATQSITPLGTANTPAFGTPTATADGFTVLISNNDLIVA